ncbi:response regulator transcription factor [uncultured Algibacter sp.]|uniref:response regulator transcription factor n=1 Tax=uncultured Algibacter sp. TaxID=298659 RepID=UPI00261CB6B1|nr:response regulator transcription factor [uncultured Algibacter sp.]
MRFILSAIVLFSISFSAEAQYQFTGHVNKDQWNSSVYLSIIDDYRKISGIHSEQIITKVEADSTGKFIITGDQLEMHNKIYRIHVDNCFEHEQNLKHFSGECNNSKTIVFIAKNNDSIDFPFSFDNEMFCDVKSNNSKTNAIIKIDSLKVEMIYDYAAFRSEANRKLNNRKWFRNFQYFGKSLNEPLAELYIYSFLTNKNSDLYQFYIEDLKTNNYYDDLLFRLKNAYPNSNYARQFEIELAADKYALQIKSKQPWHNKTLVLIALLICSLFLNMWLLIRFKRNKKNKTIRESLTKQEQNVLDLLLTGKSNKEIAQDLFISPSTVKTHLNNIFKKLNIQSREEAKDLFHK